MDALVEFEIFDFLTWGRNIILATRLNVDISVCLVLKIFLILSCIFLSSQNVF